MADFLTLKVGSIGKETKLQELMQFGSRRSTKPSRGEPSDLDRFLNTKYANTMNGNMSFDNTRDPYQTEKLSRTGSDYNDLKSRF